MKGLPDELVEVLLRRVRFLTVGQAARTWWEGSADPAANARRRIRILQRRNLVRCIIVVTPEELEPEVPLLSWAPGGSGPDFEPLSYFLRERWLRPTKPRVAVIATDHAAALYGGAGEHPPRVDEQAHDQHLASVFLHFRAHYPELARSWVHEDCDRPPPGVMLPDASVGEGHRRKAIEIAGHYSTGKLRQFHHHCEAEGLAYELW